MASAADINLRGGEHDSLNRTFLATGSSGVDVVDDDDAAVGGL